MPNRNVLTNAEIEKIRCAVESSDGIQSRAYSRDDGKALHCSVPLWVRPHLTRFAWKVDGSRMPSESAARTNTQYITRVPYLMRLHPRPFDMNLS
ncbi:hypothetical protein SK128_006746 [Halocaridina rubra]|uniref:Uncharacterized protein n=1 Tax=Halocaridina rubra TaxID=373956 RepID=A0AAN8X293_HALRR